MASSKTQAIRDIYPVFVPNQPLESKVLNELSDYFSQQDQLTRQHLIGVGILNGLKVDVETASEAPPAKPTTTLTTVTIHLSAGDCLTPNGFYLSFPATRFTHYKENQTSSVLFGSLTELVPNAESDGGFSLSQTPAKTPRTEAQLQAFLANKALVMVAELNERVRQGLIHYNINYKEKTLRTRFFLLPLPSLEHELDSESGSETAPALLEAGDFALLKQRRAFNAFLAARDRLPALRRFGYHYPLEGEGQTHPRISLSAITHTEALREQYEQTCQDAIALITAQLAAVDALMPHFPTVSEAISQSHQQQPQQPQAETNRALFPLSLGLEDELNTLLISLLENPQSLQNQTLQNYTNFLQCVAIAATDLISAIAALKGYTPAAKQQKFLMLGCPTLSVSGAESRAESGAESVCSDFVHYADIQAKATQLTFIAQKYLQLYRLRDSFDAEAALDELVLTPVATSSDWHQAKQIADSIREDRLLHQSADSSFYAIAGYHNKSCREVWARLSDYRDRYSLSFTILFLKLDGGESLVDRDLPKFHQFAQQHPGIEHLGGVPKGGTFIVLYEEDSEKGDRAIADFALPYYYIATESNLFPAPPSFAFNYPEHQTVITDQGVINNISLEPENGIVKGEGVRKADDGTYFFDVRSLQQTLTEETELSLTAQWENHQLVTPAIRVLVPPFAQFWMGDTPSKAGEFVSANRLELPTNTPVRLRLQNKGGRFSVLAFDNNTVSTLSSHETNSFDINELFSQDPLIFLPQNVPDNISEIILQYALEAGDAHYTTSLIVQLHRAETEAEQTNRIRNIVGEILPDQIQPHITDAKRVLNTEAHQAVTARVNSEEIRTALNTHAQQSVENAVQAQITSEALQAEITVKAISAVETTLQSQFPPEIETAKQTLDNRAREAVSALLESTATQEMLNAEIDAAIKAQLQNHLESADLIQRIESTFDERLREVRREMREDREKQLEDMAQFVERQTADQTRHATEAVIGSEELDSLINERVSRAIEALNRSLEDRIESVVEREMRRNRFLGEPVVSKMAVSAPVESETVDLGDINEVGNNAPLTEDEKLRNFEGDDGLLGRLLNRRK